VPQKIYDTKEARKRSVDNLQRLYTFVVSLAVTEMLRRMLSPLSTDYAAWLMFVSFLFTVVPFYHGATRYLDATYVTGERTAKHFALMFDFIFLFLEGLLLFALAMQATNREWFYTMLAVLFVFDAIWVGFTNLTGEHASDKVPSYAKWAIVNVLAAAALMVSVWSNIFAEFWRNDVAKNIALVVIAIARTVYDYISVWSFYYPPGEEAARYDNIPAPRPAPPPTSVSA
jgi:hypothetical protein